MRDLRCSKCDSRNVDRLVPKVTHCNACGHDSDYVPDCGKPPPIRMWFSACVAPYGHGGDCQFDPTPALMEVEGLCETCGNDRAAWDRLLTRVRLLESLLAEALPWWTEEGDVDSECADLVHRIADALGFDK